MRDGCRTVGTVGLWFMSCSILFLDHMVMVAIFFALKKLEK